MGFFRSLVVALEALPALALVVVSALVNIAMV